jgi:hypothetical protein
VTRFRNLGVIDPEHARSLFKQISARGWHKSEPVPVGPERAVWFSRAIAHLKNWKILSTGYRVRLAELPNVIRIITALEFYRLGW